MPELDYSQFERSSIPRWVPYTVYSAGAQIIAPAPYNSIVSAKANFTEDATFSIADWNFISDTVWMNAAEMVPISGAPNINGLAGSGYPPAWNFDATTLEQVTGSIGALPADWKTYDISLVWAATTTTLGNVAWNVGYSSLVHGALPSAGNVYLAPPVQAASGNTDVRVFKAGTGITRTANPLMLRVIRDAANAVDTYAADAALIGIQLNRAS